MTNYELFSKLKHVTRFSGLELIKSENLESHICEMIGIAMDLYNKFEDFNLDKLIYKIIIHDIDECITVDIPRPFKYYSSEFREVFKKTVNGYLKYLGFSDKFISEIGNAKDKSLEGSLLKLIDLYQVKLKLKSEVRLGNSNLVNNINEVSSFMNDLVSRDKFLNKYINYLNNLYNEKN